MNAYIKMLLVGTAIAGLYAPAAAFAQKSAGGVIGDARLHPGTWSGQGSSRSVVRSQPTYRSAAPETARSESAPTVVAQKPTEQRSYSYEPKEETKVSAGSCGCGSSARTEPAPTTAARSTESGRSFSYEPSTDSNTSTVRTVQPTRRNYSTPSSGFSHDTAMRAKGY
jgi:hypothetical protein